MTIRTWVGSAAFLAFLSGAPSALAVALLDGQTLAPATIETITGRLAPGSVLIVSEIHDNTLHHRNQVAALQALARQATNISVGFEFFEHRFQGFVDQYLAGQLEETSFLREVHWGSLPFADYREQALFPRAHGGLTVALNASSVLAAKIAKSGLESLSPEEQAELPPDFELGNELYLERFKLAMAEHVPPQAVGRYFQAQSTWD
jgi:uncharacterized iron-regulated protein